MADKTVALEATNIFGLSSAFNTAGSTTETAYENAQAMDSVGNVACQQNTGGTIRYTQSGITYCGGYNEENESGLAAYLGTFISRFGFFQTVGPVDSLTINMTSGQYATIDISGHNHSANAHTNANSWGAYFSSALAALNWDGFGVPDFGITVGSNASPSSATVTLSAAHVDTNDENGDHFSGRNTISTCTLAMQFEGLPTSVTASAIETDLGAGWLCDSVSLPDGNSAFDTFGFSAHYNARTIPFVITVSGAETSACNGVYTYDYAGIWAKTEGGVKGVYYPDDGDKWVISDDYELVGADRNVPPRTGWSITGGAASALVISY